MDALRDNYLEGKISSGYLAISERSFEIGDRVDGVIDGIHLLIGNLDIRLTVRYS